MSDPDHVASARVAVSWEKAYAGPALAFAREHRLPIINETPDWGGLRFHLDEFGWRLLEPGQAANQGYVLKFEPRYVASGKDPLLRAMGKAETVLDLTAGWGGDALHIARAGRSVVSVERDPVVYCLLCQALAHLEDRALTRRVRFLHLDAAREDFPELLHRSLGDSRPFDLVYLDPMFSDKQSKSARARKPMYLMQQLVGETEPDVELALLENALAIAKQRVVVKRALKATPISKKRLQGDIRSKLLRFDLYQP